MKSNIQKKKGSETYIILGFILAVAVLIGVLIVMHNKEMAALSGYKTAEIYSNGDDKGEIIKMNVNLFKEIRDSDKVSIIYIGRPTCTACVNFYPVIESVAEDYGLDIYYANTDEWNNDDVEKVLKKVLNKYGGTPTTLIMYKGKEINSKAGSISVNGLIQFLTEYHMIRE